jgi:hypothetical protein
VPVSTAHPLSGRAAGDRDAQQCDHARPESGDFPFERQLPSSIFVGGKLVNSSGGALDHVRQSNPPF